MMLLATREDIAGFYALALHMGLVPVSAVVTWADAQIAASDLPDVFVIDLSLAAHRPADFVIDILRRCADFPKITPRGLRMIGALLDRDLVYGARSPAATANLLYAIGKVTENAEQVFGQEIYFIDEYFEPWAEGPEKAEMEVRRIFQAFRDEPLPPLE